MGLRGGRAEGTESGGWKIEDGDGKVGRVPLCFHRAIIKPLPWGVRCVVIIPLSSSTSFIFVFLSHLSFLHLLFFLFPLFFFFLARLCMHTRRKKKGNKSRGRRDRIA